MHDGGGAVAQRPIASIEEIVVWSGRGEGRPEMFGAGEGIRTLDPDLGKVVLYP
jgi:hypothetical protein